MEVRPTGGALGAEILGVDPRSVTEGEVQDIYQALLEHEVVFLRDTQLDDEQLSRETCTATSLHAAHRWAQTKRGRALRRWAQNKRGRALRRWARNWSS